MSEERKKQADASGELDALFRSTLENQQIEPSKAIWKGISRKLLRAELTHFNFVNLPKAFWIGAASAVVVGLIFLFNQIPDGKTTENDYSPIIIKNNPQRNSSTITSNAWQPSANKKVNRGKTYSTAQTLPKGSTIQQPQLPSSGVPVLASNNSSRIIKTNKIPNAANLSSGTTSITLSGKEENSVEGHLVVSQVRYTNSYELNYLPSLAITSLIPLTEEDTLLRITNLNGIMNIPLNTKVAIPQFFTFNMGVSPELSVYRNDGQYTESNFWLNTGVTYHLGKFTVQTGLSLGYVFDQGDYRVKYRSKDSIGYFTSIISFIVTPGNKIIFTTKDIAVYDSVEHVADNRAISRYTYLQIPLLIGYELFETNRFSIGIKAGPSISFLIASKEALPFIDYPNAQLIRVDNNSLTRVEMNWEIQAALDIEYRLSKNFSIYADPSYKHYFKPFEMEESESVKAKDPYSIGIELGIRVNFGQKKIK
jgi:hypothetical protein